MVTIVEKQSKNPFPTNPNPNPFKPLPTSQKPSPTNPVPTQQYPAPAGPAKPTTPAPTPSKPSRGGGGGGGGTTTLTPIPAQTVNEPQYIDYSDNEGNRTGGITIVTPPSNPSRGTITSSGGGSGFKEIVTNPTQAEINQAKEVGVPIFSNTLAPSNSNKPYWMMQSTNLFDAVKEGSFASQTPYTDSFRRYTPSSTTQTNALSIAYNQELFKAYSNFEKNPSQYEGSVGVNKNLVFVSDEVIGDQLVKTTGYSYSLSPNFIDTKAVYDTAYLKSQQWFSTLPTSERLTQVGLTMGKSAVQIGLSTAEFNANLVYNFAKNTLGSNTVKSGKDIKLLNWENKYNTNFGIKYLPSTPTASSGFNKYITPEVGTNIATGVLFAGNIVKGFKGFTRGESLISDIGQATKIAVPFRFEEGIFASTKTVQFDKIRNYKVTNDVSVFKGTSAEGLSDVKGIAYINKNKITTTQTVTTPFVEITQGGTKIREGIRTVTSASSTSFGSTGEGILTSKVGKTKFRTGTGNEASIGLQETNVVNVKFKYYQSEPVISSDIGSRKITTIDNYNLVSKDFRLVGGMGKNINPYLSKSYVGNAEYVFTSDKTLKGKFTPKTLITTIDLRNLPKLEPTRIAGAKTTSKPYSLDVPETPKVDLPNNLQLSKTTKPNIPSSNNQILQQSQSEYYGTGMYERTESLGTTLINPNIKVPKFGFQDTVTTTKMFIPFSPSIDAGRFGTLIDERNTNKNMFSSVGVISTLNTNIAKDIEKVKFGVDTNTLQIQPQATSQSTKQIQLTTQSTQSFNPNYNFNFDTQIKNPRFIPPFIPRLPFNFDELSLGSSTKAGGRKKTRYAPSLGAVLFNRKGRRNKRLAKTGIDFRPIKATKGGFKL